MRIRPTPNGWGQGNCQNNSRLGEPSRCGATAEPACGAGIDHRNELARLEQDAEAEKNAHDGALAGTKLRGGGVMATVLSEKECALIDAYWRAANYLSVGQIYLFDNPLLKEPLSEEHIKPRLLGHWGTTPGLNFIYVHLNRLIKKHDLDMIYIAGPGHGGPGAGRQRLSRRHLQRGLSERRAGRSRDEAAVQAVLVPRRHPEPRRAGDAGLDPRGRRTRLFAVARLWRGLRQSRPDRRLRRSATARPRPGRSPRAGTRTSSSIPCATAPCCRSCTSTATRSPIRRCSRASRMRSSKP